MENVPDQSIETVARSFFKESSEYGFSPVDYLKFVNYVLDLSAGSDPDSPDEHAGRHHVDLKHNNDSGDLPVEGENVRIRAFDVEADLDLLQKWLADKYGRHFLLSCSTARAETVEELLDSDSTVMGMITAKDDSPIGCLAFLEFDPLQKRAELRKLIGEPSMRGHGLAKEATRLWIRHGLARYDLEKIYVSTLNTNLRNIRLNEDLGFQMEGILRDEVFFDGKRHDVLRMGLVV